MTQENKAVFLDRDGVLIHDVHYLSDLKQVHLYPDVAAGLQTLRKKGFKLIMVTNQSGVARGYFDEDFVIETHKYLSSLLLDYGVSLDAEYYCPHHLSGKPPYNKQCNCRKPGPGMIQQASKDHDIDCNLSFVVGDKLSDIELAVNTNSKGILVTTGHGADHSTKVRAKYPQIPIVNSFTEAVLYICNHT